MKQTIKPLWVIFKCQPNDPGWENRLLMPAGNCTQILHEEWWFSGDMPEVGDRPREYADLPNVEAGTTSTHGRDSDWLVTKVSHYTCPDDERDIVVCECVLAPIDDEWQEIPVGKPLTELLPASVG